MGYNNLIKETEQYNNLLYCQYLEAEAAALPLSEYIL